MNARDRLPSVTGSLKELDAQQTLFLATLLELGAGHQHGPAAALVAGYGTTYEEASRHARILLKSPKIMKALKEAIVHRFDVAAGAAFNTLLNICVNGRSESARISASQEILNRSSLGPVPSRSLSVVAKVGGIEELLDRADAHERAAAAKKPPILEGQYTERHPRPSHSADSEDDNSDEEE
jgi:hypothetical protein